MEVMAHMIQNNPKIKGVNMNEARRETNIVISQFADDTAIFLDFSEECIRETISTLAHLERNTGLKISYEKSTIYRIGSLRNSDAKIYTQKQLQWSDRIWTY